MIVSCFPELQLPGFTGVDDPFMKALGHPHLYPFTLRYAPSPGSDLQRSQRSGVYCGSLVSSTCLCPGCASPHYGKGRPLARFSPGPPFLTLLEAPRWGWGRLRTSLASGIKVSGAVSLVPTPAPCSPWALRWGGEPGHCPKAGIRAWVGGTRFRKVLDSA